MLLTIIAEQPFYHWEYIENISRRLKMAGIYLLIKE